MITVRKLPTMILFLGRCDDRSKFYCTGEQRCAFGTTSSHPLSFTCSRLQKSPLRTQALLKINLLHKLDMLLQENSIEPPMECLYVIVYDGGQCNIGQLAPGVGTRAKLAVGVAERPLGS